MKALLLFALMTGLLPAVGGATHPEAPKPARRPNVIFILTDDQGYGDLGCTGNTMIRTPNLDRLYGESVRLANYHVDPTCAPTRAALMTGRYSTRTGVWHTVMGRSLMYRDEVTMADVFSNAGYRTGIFGKWHLGDNYPMRPQDRGFQEVLVHGGGGVTQTPDHWGNDYVDDTYQHNGKPEKYTGYCTDVFFERALEFIAADTARPFLAYIATNAPHAPFIVPAKYRQPYTEQGVPPPMDSFYGMITNIDENVGRLTARLQELGLAENTILIWSTDNGTAAGVAGVNEFTAAAAKDRQGWNGFNAGMRGIKGSEYDGGHRVPLFIRWPAGSIGGGRDVSAITAHIDMLPTLIDLCGLTPPQVAFDGMSLAPWLRGTPPAWPERTLFVHNQRREIPPKWERGAVMTDRWRYVGGSALYDIHADPAEKNDVAGQYPEVVASLRARYETWWASLAPALTRYGYIVVGSEHENPSPLNCMDWHDDNIKNIPWNQRQIDAMPWANGYWMIEAAQAGRYEFTLRQKPAAAQFPLEGTQARVRVGDREVTAAIPAGTPQVTLALDLPAGPARLQTWLLDQASGQSRGAFFVEIRRLN